MICILQGGCVMPNVILSAELIKKIIEENNYIPDNALNHMTTEEFRSIYGIDALKSFEKGKELLEFLFGRYQQNEKSLAYSLESNVNITSFFGEAKPGFATTKILNHSKGSWKKFKSNIEESEAIEIAFNIRNSLVQVLEKITDSTDALEIRAMLEAQGLYTEQNWLKKYFTILYPDKFMTMLNEDWISRIFVPLGLTPSGDWFKDAKEFSEKAKEFNVDSVNFYHAVFKCATQQVKQELAELGVDTSKLAAPGNLLVNTRYSFEGIKKYIESEELQEKFENYLAYRYNWDSKPKTITDITTETPKDKKSIFLDEYTQIILDAKNTIFRGAPGTGKSYLAKSIASRIVSNGSKTSYKELSEQEKQQIEFVQFHPSYDYSDFVEGLRPVEKNGALGFELRNGIFKEFVERAKENYENSIKSQEDIEKETSIEENINDFLENSLDGQEFETLHGNKFTISSYDDKRIHIFIPNNEISHTLSIKIDDIRKLFASEQKFNSIREVRHFFGKKHATQEHSYIYILYKSLLENSVSFIKPSTEKETLKNYVFIIDEINRGEIAKILGELFFSIDPGYRGEDGSVSTQYANLHANPDEKFYIPKNVYIIGTMNDIDRSVDTFDFAMRRRFRFIEIDADKHIDMLDKLNDETKKQEAIKRMRSLNAVIEKEEGLGKNYQIGAAYFLKLQTIGFENLWSDHLEPLLQEYINGVYNEKDILKKFKNAYNLMSEFGENDYED